VITIQYIMSCLPNVPRRIQSLNTEDVRTRFIIDGVYWPSQRVNLLVVCTLICVVWCVELGMRREMWWSCCGCLFCLNEDSALACSLG
jgi:hypothetical protein